MPNRYSAEKNLDWSYKEKETRSRLLAIPILLYHNIDGKGEFSIDANVLRSQFQLIKDKNIKVVKLKELTDRLENPVQFKEKVIVITFDDGYYSMYSKLLPLAKEFDYPVTLFIYSDFIRTVGKKNMTWDLLRELDNNLIDIQVHSISHADLNSLSGMNNAESRKKLYEEIYLSKRIVELYMRKEKTFFAFPYGRYNLKLIDLSKKSGYIRVFSTDYGSNVITRNNFCLRRHHIKRKYSMGHFEKIIENSILLY